MRNLTISNTGSCWWSGQGEENSVGTMWAGVGAPQCQLWSGGNIQSCNKEVSNDTSRFFGIPQRNTKRKGISIQNITMNFNLPTIIWTYSQEANWEYSKDLACKFTGDPEKLTLKGFGQYLQSTTWNCIYDSRFNEVYHSMDHPFARYWIAAADPEYWYPMIMLKS